MVLAMPFAAIEGIGATVCTMRMENGLNENKEV
jgi:hypothetical protein